MSDFDTRTSLLEFWDDNAIDVWVKVLLWRLLCPEAVGAEVAFTEANDVFVFGVVSIEYP